MATLGRDISASTAHKGKSWAKKLERCCCGSLAYLPLIFVYGLTTWAAWVGIKIGFHPQKGYLNGALSSLLIFILYALADVSYSIAVFTNPGSPLDSRSAKSSHYSSLPTHETDTPLPSYSSLTTKSTGRPRYCKKCQCTKPDRAHHCSTCGRCVLKMDHHCPWLATCVGLRNYKAFMLFLTYTSALCWVCFAVASEWTFLSFKHVDTFEQGTFTVHIILLAVLGGIFGLVLTGFAGWHYYLASSNQTTIECLEKTRYLSPLKKSMEQQFQRANQRHVDGHRHMGGAQHDDGSEQSEPLLDQLKEIHANALPGILRPEEGEERSSNSSTPQYDGLASSPARDALRRSYAELESQRERDRYETYLDEKDSERLPHAFDLGWRTNLRSLFGDKWWLWCLPVCNTIGDGWQWEVSEKWVIRREEVARQRLERQRDAEQRWHDGAANGFAMPAHSPFVPPVMGAGRHYAAPPREPPPPGVFGGSANGGVHMRDLSKDDDGDGYDTSSDEEQMSGHPKGGQQVLQSSGRRKGD